MGGAQLTLGKGVYWYLPNYNDSWIKAHSEVLPKAISLLRGKDEVLIWGIKVRNHNVLFGAWGFLSWAQYKTYR